MIDWIAVYWLFILLALVSEIIGTISGFGSSILFVPIAALFFEFNEVLGITAVFHVFSNLSKIALFRKGIDMRIVRELGIPAVIFVIIGALLTAYIPGKEIELLMNISLLLLAVYLIFNFNTKIAQSRSNLIIGGSVSGFLAGLIGTGGAIRGLTLSAFHLEKQVFVATSALIDLGVDSSRAVIYIAQGYFKQEFLVIIPFLIGVSILGSWIGKLILDTTTQVIFRYIVLGTIILTTLIQLYSFFNEQT
jgi:uncharacterized membrane protein YfcA